MALRRKKFSFEEDSIRWRAFLRSPQCYLCLWQSENSGCMSQHHRG